MSKHMELEQILRQTRSVAVVGASANPMRPSYGVYQYLRANSAYALYPVNPTIGELDGDTVYPSLADLPVVPDMVDVFRRYDELPSVLAEVLALPSVSNPPRLPKTLWLQQGLFHEQVGREAAAAGLTVVMDRCLKVDHAQLIRG